MIPSLIIIALAYLWLLKETDWLRIRLLIGKELPRYGAGRTMAQWDEYNKAHAKELEREQKEYAKRQAYIKAHTCPICRTLDDSRLIEPKVIKVGNSTATITACKDCTAKLEKEMITSQKGNTRQPTIKTIQLPLFVEEVRIGSHWSNPKKRYGIVDEYETIFHDCLPGKDWLKLHYKDEYPEPSIEISVDSGKSLSLNGNYKKGTIQGFMGEYTHKVRAGKKTMTVNNGDVVVNMGGGVYVAVTPEPNKVEA